MLCYPFILPSTIRPSRTEVSERGKDEEYHRKMARYFIGLSSSQQYANFYTRAYTNWSFYQNQQWIYGEDLDPFLQDESGDVRDRIRMNWNIIQPFVKQGLDDVRNTSMQYTSKGCSEGVINRRESELSRMKWARNLADEYPALEDTIKRSIPIGKDMDQTKTIFNNAYTDQLEVNINRILKYVDDNNKITDTMKLELARYMYVTGLAVAKGYEQGGDHIWERVQSEMFFYDFTAIEPDLTDSNYMGDLKYGTPTEIYEMFPNLTADQRDRLERWAQLVTPAFWNVQQMFGALAERIPAIYVEWKDIEPQDWGFVEDEYGYEYLTRIYSDKSQKIYKGGTVYTKKDLIEPQFEDYKNWMGGKKIRKIPMEVLRYAIFTPAELFAGTGSEDIVYEYGIVPYQSVDSRNPRKVEFSYKCQCWDYHNGNIVSPMDVLIDPQRFINRTMSVAEARLNNGEGQGNIFDTMAIDPQLGQEETSRRVKSNKDIYINSRGLGIPNVVGRYGMQAADNGAEVLFNVANQVRGFASSMVGEWQLPGGKEGKNGALGAEMDSKSLHGTTLYAMEQIMQQIFQAISSQGKRIYCNSPRRLTIVAGDEGAKEIMITKEMNLEDFRIFIKRTDDDKASKEQANMILLQMLQTGMITKTDAANHYGRISLNDVGKVLRDAANRMEQAQQAQQEAQQKQQQQQVAQQGLANEQMQAEMKRRESVELQQKEEDRVSKLEQISARGATQMARDRQKESLRKDNDESMERLRHDLEKRFAKEKK